MLISPTSLPTVRKMPDRTEKPPLTGVEREALTPSDTGPDEALLRRYESGLFHGVAGAIPFVGTAWHMGVGRSDKAAQNSNFGQIVSRSGAAMNAMGTSALLVGIFCSNSSVVAGGVGLLMASGVTGAVNGALLGHSAGA